MWMRTTWPSGNGQVERKRKERKMNSKVLEWLKERQENIKAEFAVVGITPRQFSRFGGDYDYAEWEIIEQFRDLQLWDGWENYDEITTHREFVKAARWGAAYNTIA
jgi:hypothetical protein